MAVCWRGSKGRAIPLGSSVMWSSISWARVECRYARSRRELATARDSAVRIRFQRMVPGDGCLDPETQLGPNRYGTSRGGDRGLANRDERELYSRLTVLLMHLLKCHAQPG